MGVFNKKFNSNGELMSFFSKTKIATCLFFLILASHTTLNARVGPDEDYAFCTGEQSTAGTIIKNIFNLKDGDYPDIDDESFPKEKLLHVCQQEGCSEMIWVLNDPTMVKSCDKKIAIAIKKDLTKLKKYFNKDASNIGYLSNYLSEEEMPVELAKGDCKFTALERLTVNTTKTAKGDGKSCPINAVTSCLGKQLIVCEGSAICGNPQTGDQEEVSFTCVSNGSSCPKPYECLADKKIDEWVQETQEMGLEMKISREDITPKSNKAK